MQQLYLMYETQRGANLCRVEAGGKVVPPRNHHQLCEGRSGQTAASEPLYWPKNTRLLAKVSGTTEPKRNNSVSAMKATPARFGHWLQVLAELAEQLLTRSTITSKHSWVTPDSTGIQLV